MQGFQVSVDIHRPLYGASSAATLLLKNAFTVTTKKTYMAIGFLLCGTLSMLSRHGGVHAFQQGHALSSILLVSRRQQRHDSSCCIRPQQQQQHNMILSSRDADLVEQWVGGERYSLIPMPDIMKATTVFVGNLCEFVQDEDLSRFFAAAATHLSRVPATVVRKPDTQSLRYGFVSFPTRQEKEVCVFVFVYFVRLWLLGVSVLRSCSMRLNPEGNRKICGC